MTPPIFPLTGGQYRLINGQLVPEGTEPAPATDPTPATPDSDSEAADSPSPNTKTRRK